MGKIEISMPEAEKALPILHDAIEREKHLLLQSLARAEERIQHMSAHLQVDPDRLLAGEVPHSDEQDMALLELARLYRVSGGMFPAWGAPESRKPTSDAAFRVALVRSSTILIQSKKYDLT